MLDWQNIIYNALWLFALAGMIAVLSWRVWESRESRVSGAAIFPSAHNRLYHLMGLFFCIGLAGSALSSPAVLTWRAILWSLLATAFLGFALFER